MYIHIFVCVYIYIFFFPYIYVYKENLECWATSMFLRRDWDLSRKCNFWPFSWQSNLRPRESSAMLCQLNYGSRCQEHGYEFRIYGVVKPIK